MLRRTPNSLAWLALVLASATSSAAEPAGVTVQLGCRPEAAPGRVLCELQYRAAAGARLVWADALVTKTPEFARPLRSRVSPERFSDTAPSERKLSLGFVASQAGVGQVGVRARAVICRGQGKAETCRPETHDVTAELRVGS